MAVPGHGHAFEDLHEDKSSDTKMTEYQWNSFNYRSTPAYVKLARKADRMKYIFELVARGEMNAEEGLHALEKTRQEGFKWKIFLCVCLFFIAIGAIITGIRGEMPR
jgi:hypothetical protein